MTSNTLSFRKELKQIADKNKSAQKQCKEASSCGEYEVKIPLVENWKNKRDEIKSWCLEKNITYTFYSKDEPHNGHIVSYDFVKLSWR
jgi:hypothetical protein